MIRRDGYIHGVPCWVDTTQADPASAAEFYGGLFGWELADAMPPDAPGRYLMARLDGGDVAAIGSPPAGAPPVALWNTYIWADSADETAAKVVSAGGSVEVEPFDVMDAGRMAVVVDPEGAAFCVWQAKGHRGAAVVNEPGSLNFNVLNTRDPARARSFYGEVFGWEVLDLGRGGELWTLPGYCDFLEQRDPGLRERMAAMGAPAGFEDVVASLAPLPADQPDARPSWGVTFAVADADAIAARAVQLGGRVVVAPFDAPWVRMAVIADPQGAVFTASQFVPDNQAAAQAQDSAMRGS